MKRGGKKPSGPTTREPVFLSSITAHSWNADHTQVAVAPNSNLVHIYDAKGDNPKQWNLVHTLKDHFMTVTDIDWNHATNMIATSGQDRNAYVWNFAEGEWKPTLVILRIGRSATCARWSPNGRKFAVGSGSKQIPVCHYEEKQDMWVAKMIKKGPKSTVLCVDWSPNNLFLIAGGSDFKCRIFSAFVGDVDTDSKVDDVYQQAFGPKCTEFGAILAEFDQSRGWIEACRFSPSGMRFAFSGHDSTVHFGEIGAQGTEVQTILRRDLPVRALGFIDEDTAVGGGYDNVPIVYNFSNGRWEEKGPLDTGKKEEKKASGSAFNKWQSMAKRGAGANDDDIALPFRHQNIINDIYVFEKGGFTTSSTGGRILHWRIDKEY